MFCALAGKAAGGDGHGYLDQLRRACLFLSSLFMSEGISWVKIAGTLLTLGGVALLSWEQKIKVVAEELCATKRRFTQNEQ